MEIPKNAQQEWEAYREQEFSRLLPLLETYGFSLSEEQVHISGERFLMSGKKLVLFGTRQADQKKVIIKASSDPNARQELVQEHRARKTIARIDFSYAQISLPEEIEYKEAGGTVLLITEFIEERQAFLEMDTYTQFFFALRACEIQEGFHLATYGHHKEIEGTFQRMTAKDYLQETEDIVQELSNLEAGSPLRNIWHEAAGQLRAHERQIDVYGDFLTHTDFVPHNVRVLPRGLCFIDFASLRFGCKYESWARWVNYMELHHPQLAQWMHDFVRENRPEEYAVFRMMRVYKLLFLIRFYARNLKKTEGDLHQLTRARLVFWSMVLEKILADQPIPASDIEAYRAERNLLRSDEEKRRQQVLHQP